MRLVEFKINARNRATTFHEERADLLVQGNAWSCRLPTKKERRKEIIAQVGTMIYFNEKSATGVRFECLAQDSLRARRHLGPSVQAKLTLNTTPQPKPRTQPHTSQTTNKRTTASQQHHKTPLARLRRGTDTRDLKKRRITVTISGHNSHASTRHTPFILRSFQFVKIQEAKGESQEASKYLKQYHKTSANEAKCVPSCTNRSDDNAEDSRERLDKRGHLDVLACLRDCRGRMGGG